MKSISRPAANDVDSIAMTIIATVVAVAAVKIGIALIIRKITHE